MKELVEWVARHLVSEPDAVSVTESEQDGAECLELRVAPQDLGRVIGREGRTARAMRAIVSVAAAVRNTRATLEIVEESDDVPRS